MGFQYRQIFCAFILETIISKKEFQLVYNFH
jgi:hypothetical protein